MTYYSSHALSFFDDTRDLDISALYSPFLAEIPKGGRILDAGCGSGRDLKAFLDLGYLAEGFDSSPELVHLASAHSKANVYCCTFGEMASTHKFDGIWACASLLHVEKQRIGKVVSHLSALLNEKGIFYMSFKAGDNERLVGERWFNCYTPHTLRQMLASETGLSVRKLWVTEDIRPQINQKWVNCLARKQTTTPKAEHEQPRKIP